ncbi:iron dicitrate transporter FecR [Bacteroidia bacterium]|nr:iron dicitrate transporter FecR [Bacteroidia bacterium]
MNKEICLHIFERYISGEASPDEIVQLKSFLENDINLNRWLENQTMGLSGTIDPDIKMRMLENIRSRTNYDTLFVPVDSKNKNFRFYLRWVSNIAAILLPVVIIFGIYLYLIPQKKESFEVIADKGEKASLTLAEGSLVAINSGSKIMYYNNYNRKDRFLKLEGEAYFDVKYNPEKPFIVECGDVKIRVLGTSFGIKAYENEDNISIVLKSGRIQLTTPKEEIEMVPDDRIEYNKITQTTSLEKVNAGDYTDWRQNRLRFENESLETIMKTISRMHNIDIVFENPQLKNQQFTGTIDNTSIKSVLEAIKLTSLINYRLKDGVVCLYENN